MASFPPVFVLYERPLSVTRRVCLGAVALSFTYAGHAQTTRTTTVTLVGRGLWRPFRAWLDVPPGAPPAGGWPLVVYLHGSGERGDDLRLARANGLPKQVDSGGVLPFALLTPQLDTDRPDWDADELHAMLPLLAVRLSRPGSPRLNLRRVAATGLSMGGYGVWAWALRHPADLRAAVPICGIGDPARACAARRVPVRAYHGDADTVVPLVDQQRVVDALRACGGEVEFIVYPGVGHDSWELAYRDPALLPWLSAMLARTRQT